MSTINRLATDKFKVVFSNIPLPQSRTTPLNIGVMNNFVRSVTLPDYNIEIQKADFGNFSRPHPMTKINNELTQLQLEMIVDEDMENYYAIYEWMREIKSGRPTQGHTTLHESTISDIIIQLLDNEDREKSRLKFQGCILASLSSLTMTYGSSEQVVFTMTLTYSDFTLERSSNVTNN